MSPSPFSFESVAHYMETDNLRNTTERLKNVAYAAKLLRLQEERSRQTGPGGLMHFVRYFWRVLEPGREFIDGWALDAVAEHLEAVERGELPRLLITVPPGFMKSLMINVWFMCWLWGPQNKPHFRSLSFSYAAHLTERDNEKCRTLISSRPYQELWGDRFKLASDSKIKISNNHQGWLLASSVGGISTGERGDLIRCDDPHNAIQGESERVRNETVRWFKESMSNRLNDMEKSSIIVVHQRLHELDVAGSIIEDSQGMGYEHLCIPMRYESDGPWAKSTSIGWEDPRTVDGELAWPERFPAKVVDDLERDLGPFGFAAQYMQNPAPRGGGIIKRNWFRLWEHPQNKFPAFENVVAAVDPAYTEKDENDPSAMAIFATFRHPETNEFGIMLVHCWSKRLPIHGDTSPRFQGESHKAYERRCGDNWGLVEWIWHCCDAYGVQQLFIEGKASGLSVFQEIERRQSLRPWACDIDTGKGAGDKTNRLTSVQPLFSQGLIWAPDRDWSDLFINQLCSYPKARHDDLVDCASSALRKMREMGLIQHTDEREYEELVEQNRPQALAPLYPV